MTWAALVALVAIGCGRFQFESHDAPLARDDTGPDGEATDAAPCNFTFCDDFMGTTVGAGWDSTQIMGNATASQQGGTLVVTLPATSDAYFLVKQLPAPTTSIRISLRMRYSTTNAGTDCELDLVALNWDSGTCGLPFGYYFVRDGTGPFNLQETNGAATCTANRNNYETVRDGTGPHVYDLGVTLGAAGVAYWRVDIDGVMFMQRTTLQPVPSAPLTFKLGGVGVRNVAGTWTIEYENLQIDVD